MVSMSITKKFAQKSVGGSDIFSATATETETLFVKTRGECDSLVGTIYCVSFCDWIFSFR